MSDDESDGFVEDELFTGTVKTISDFIAKGINDEAIRRTGAELINDTVVGGVTGIPKGLARKFMMTFGGDRRDELIGPLAYAIRETLRDDGCIKGELPSIRKIKKALTLPARRGFDVNSEEFIREIVEEVAGDCWQPSIAEAVRFRFYGKISRSPGLSDVEALAGIAGINNRMDEFVQHANVMMSGMRDSLSKVANPTMSDESIRGCKVASIAWVPELPYGHISRKKLTDEIDNLFSRGLRCCVIRGFSGTGKTRLALEYAKRFQCRLEEVSRITLPEGVGIARKYSDSDLANGLGAKCDDIEEAEAVCKAFFERLAGMSHRCIVIVDNFNIPDLDLLRRLTGGQARVVVTSNASAAVVSEACRLIAGVGVVDLDEIEEDDEFLRDMFLALCSEVELDDGQKVQLKEFFDELGRLPIFVAAVGGLVGQSANVQNTFEALLENRTVPDYMVSERAILNPSGDEPYQGRPAVVMHAILKRLWNVSELSGMEKAVLNVLCLVPGERIRCCEVSATLKKLGFYHGWQDDPDLAMGSLLGMRHMLDGAEGDIWIHPMMAKALRHDSGDGAVLPIPNAGFWGDVVRSGLKGDGSYRWFELPSYFLTGPLWGQIRDNADDLVKCDASWEVLDHLEIECYSGFDSAYCKVHARDDECVNGCLVVAMPNDGGRLNWLEYVPVSIDGSIGFDSNGLGSEVTGTVTIIRCCFWSDGPNFRMDVHDAIRSRMISPSGRHDVLCIDSISSTAFVACVDAKSISIPGSIKKITSHSFYGCFDLECIELGNGVEKVEEYAFHCCMSLKVVTLPSTVTWIGSCAFRACPNLTLVRCHERMPKMADDAFCDSVPEVIVIPESTSASSGDCILPNAD